MPDNESILSGGSILSLCYGDEEAASDGSVGYYI